MWLAASLALVEPCQWRGTSAFLPQIRVDLQICVDHLEIPEAEVRMLAMAKGPPTTFRRIVGRLPLRTVEEHAQPGEVLGIEMLLLFAEGHQGSGRSIIPPGVVVLLGFSGRSSVAIRVPPDREPRFQERAGDAEHRSSGARQKFRERLLLFSAEVVWAAQEQASVEPEILAHLTDLVPVMPGLREWLDRRRRSHGLDRLGERGGIRQGKLQPAPHRILIDANGTGQGTG